MAAYTEMMFGTKDARGARGWILDGHVTGTHNGAPGIRLFIRTSMSAYCRRCFFSLRFSRLRRRYMSAIYSTTTVMERAVEESCFFSPAWRELMFRAFTSRR